MAKKNSFITNNTLGMGDYIYLVDEIVGGFFGENGEYQPHIGTINAMRIYYNVCVKECEYDKLIPHNVIELGELQPVIDNKDFRECFSLAISNTDSFDISFGNAYKKATEIIEQRNYSIKAGVDEIKKAIIELSDRISPAFSEDTLTQLNTIAKEIDKGNLTPNALWEAYEKSEAFKQTLDRADKRARIIVENAKK